MIYIVTLGYDTTERIKRAVRRFFSTTDLTGLEIEYKLVDCKYPIPSKSKNSKELAEFCTESNLSGIYPCSIDLFSLARNNGQDGNVRLVHSILNPKDDDIVLYYCADVAPTKPEWLQDAVKVLAEPDVGLVVMNCRCTDNSLKNQGSEYPVQGIKVRELTWHGGYSVCFFKGKCINQIPLNQTRAYYGGTEYNVLMLVRARGLRAFMMVDHDDARDVDNLDLSYLQWKHEMLHRTDQIDFEEYARQRGLIQE